MQGKSNPEIDRLEIERAKAKTRTKREKGLLKTEPMAERKLLFPLLEASGLGRSA